jgi:hypothetical protein
MPVIAVPYECNMVVFARRVILPVIVKGIKLDSDALAFDLIVSLPAEPDIAAVPAACGTHIIFAGLHQGERKTITVLSAVV